MCGIVIEFNLNNKKPNDEIMTVMLEAIKHRGYDDIKIKNYGKFSIGFRRLAITDIHVQQPATHGDWEVFLNGEIYNYKELGYEGSECEVLAKGLSEHGVDFVSQLNGMFFIAAVHKEQVYVFRDRYGMKPIYYTINDERILVASEIKAIKKHPSFEFKVNEHVKKQWFAFNNVFTQETLFTDVYKLPKGTYFNLNTITAVNYWNWKFNPHPMDYDYALNKVRELVTQAVNRQIPQCEYGTCLSSGIDSNIINALCGDTYTFTAGFTEGNDERAIAARYGKKHYEIGYNKVRFMDETIYHLEDLRVGASWSNYGLYELASKYVKVLFDGAGADELFGGYQWRYDAKDYYTVLNRTGIGYNDTKKLFKTKFPVDTLEERYRFDANHFLEGVLLVGDKLSMAHTIEMRMPFLDNDLVDFCLLLPNEYKKNKHILKSAFSNLLSEEILAQPKKGFSSPDWFYGSGNQADKWASNAFDTWLNIYKNK